MFQAPGGAFLFSVTLYIHRECFTRRPFPEGIAPLVSSPFLPLRYIGLLPRTMNLDVFFLPDDR
ncbi:MAG TPA: hypothetical protein DHU85_04940 [Porphyromonadaceae bacterium]|nr:MAG TPA: hypothetical protein [Caudoviricetes sp.]DAU82024.1 MAG TPA: hypothetical protein [Caudoviricetes sp.]HCZ20852.1 hypothetical protein [Porphyromonadaceae bacterium]